MRTTLAIRKIILSLAIITIVFLITCLFHSTQAPYKYFLQGSQYFKQRQYEKALHFLEYSYRLKPQNIDTAVLLMWTYKRLGMENKMQALLDYLWGLDIRDLEIVQQVADAFYSLKDYPRAEILYRKVFNRTKNIDTENKLTEVLVWQKKYDEALPVLEDLVNKKPRDLNLLKFFADVCAWAKKYDKAIGLYKRLLSYSQDKEEIVLRLADLLRFSGKNEEAIRLYNQYLKEKK